MCTGVEIAAIIGATAAVGGVAVSSDTARQAKNARGDAERGRLKAETESAQRASAQTQMARRSLAKNSLFTGGGTAGTAGGSSTLGAGIGGG